MIAFAAGALAFFLGRMLLPLAIIPLPIVLVFAVLALPLRKDQPMETYLAALIKFYFSPHIRLWDPDGQDSLVEISNPIVDDTPRTKEVGGEEAARRLSFLADVSDTQGWATRGVGPVNTTILHDDLAAEASTTTDILEGSDSLSQSIDNMLVQSNQQVRQAAVERMQNDVPAPTPPPVTTPFSTPTQTAATPVSQPVVNSQTTAMPTPATAQPPITPTAPSPYASVQAMATAAPTVAISEVDEASAQALLRQAAANAPTSNQLSMQQKVIQPLGGVFGSTSHSTQNSVAPANSISVPERSPTAPPVAPSEPTPPTSPAETESATIEPTETTDSIESAEESRTVDLGSDDNSNETVISLH